MLQNCLFKSITKTAICSPTVKWIELGDPLPQNRERKPVQAEERQSSGYVKVSLRSTTAALPAAVNTLEDRLKCC